MLMAEIPTLPERSPKIRARPKPRVDSPKPTGQPSLTGIARGIAQQRSTPEPETKVAAAKGVVGDTIKGAGKGAAQSAIAGAASGGTALVAGSVKGAVTAFVKNSTARRWIIWVVVFLILTLVAIPLFITTTVISSIGMFVDSNNEISAAAVEESGVDPETVYDFITSTSRGEVPWQVTLAVSQKKNVPFDADRLVAEVRKADPNREFRDLGIGTVFNVSDSNRTVGTSDAHKAAAKGVKDMYVAALTAYGLSSAESGQVFDQALKWFLGQGTLACTPVGGMTTPGGSGAPGGTNVGEWAFDTEQMTNAITIIGVAKSTFASESDQRRAAIIAVATAHQESGMRRIDYGDTAGPDSRGLFQQREAGWGSLALRMSADGAAATFLGRLAGVAGWQTMVLSEAAIKVQIYQDGLQPHYDKHEQAATAFVNANFATAQAVPIPAESTQITGVGNGGVPGTPGTTPSTAPGATGSCGGGGSGPGIVGGWTSPIAIGTAGLSYVDFYGPRFGVPGARPFHYGIDLAVPMDTPIVAVAAGTVVEAQHSGSGGLGNTITIEHGDGSHSQYNHLNVGGVLVNVGDTVTAGQHIGNSGMTGLAYGPHLDFRTFAGAVGDAFGQDPIYFLLAKGVDLRVIPVGSDLSTTPTF